MLETGRTRGSWNEACYSPVITGDGNYSTVVRKRSALLSCWFIDSRLSPHSQWCVCVLLLVQRLSCSCNVQTVIGFILLFCASAAMQFLLMIPQYNDRPLPKLWFRLCREKVNYLKFIFLSLAQNKDTHTSKDIHLRLSLRKQEEIMRTANNVKWATCAAPVTHTHLCKQHWALLGKNTHLLSLLFCYMQCASIHNCKNTRMTRNNAGASCFHSLEGVFALLLEDDKCCNVSLSWCSILCFTSSEPTKKCSKKEGLVSV